MGSMHTGLEEARGGYAKMAAYFAERARGGVGLIVTGGISPNFSGRVGPFSAQLSHFFQVYQHRKVTQAVHAEGGKIALQILHAGRYSYHPLAVSASSIKSPISPFRPRALTNWGVKKTIRDYAHCAYLAKKAGYDGVEVMGSEGYLINQFIVAKTNRRKDSWGGDYKNRIRFPIEIVREIRKKVGPQFIIIFRLSMLDLIEGGSTWDEIVQLGKEIEKAGATLINTGIGWHEARIPTIATMVPRAAFTAITRRMKSELKIPLITTNRINMPQVAEDVLANHEADMVSMARPFLADPEFVNKAAEGRDDEINTCIGCNQACLDHIFSQKRATCLVNPRACYETEIKIVATRSPKKIAVVGAGPAGLSFATTAAKRGHNVTLFDAEPEIGGQFNLAKKIPGKEEFSETIRYFKKQLLLSKVNQKLGKPVTAKELIESAFDHIVLATGVKARTPKIEGIGHPKVVTYLDVLREKVTVGKSVAIIGAGGIGFDVAEYLADDKEGLSQNKAAFAKHWGIDFFGNSRGGVSGVKREVHEAKRKVYLLSRTPGKQGERLGKTTGWIHRTQLKEKKVTQLSGVTYEKIDDRGLHLSIPSDKGPQKLLLEVDHIVVCAGQDPERSLLTELLQNGAEVSLIGGADVATELDAKRAIQQGLVSGYKK